MIGEKIRELRKIRNLSLSELSARVGVSDSYVSQLERNIVDPSVSVLKKIAAVLEVPIATFFDEDYEEPFLLKKDAYAACPSPARGFRLERISPSAADWGNRIEVLKFHLSPGALEQSLSHQGELCIHITRGTGQITLEDTVHLLKKGDSIYIRPGISYKLSNPGSSMLSGMLCSLISKEKESEQ